MKKIIALLLVICVVLSFAACGKDNTPAEEKNTELVEMSLVSAIYKDGKPDRKYEYDERGNEKLYINYDEDGEVFIEESSIYDEMDNKIRSVYTADGKVSENDFKYTYDKNGNILLKLSKEDGDEYSYEYKYDKIGNIKEFVLKENGIQQNKTKYSYDDNGNKIKEDMYSRNGALVGSSVYEYDEKGNNTLNVFYYNGEERQKSVYTYDEKGNLIEDVYYEEGGEGSREKYFYDEKGNQIEWLSYFQGEFSGRYVYEYNGENQLIKEYYFEYENDTEAYYTEEYIYNEKGLLVEEIHRNRSDEKAQKYTYEYITVTVPAYRVETIKESQEIILL